MALNAVRTFDSYPWNLESWKNRDPWNTIIQEYLQLLGIIILTKKINWCCLEAGL